MSAHAATVVPMFATPFATVPLKVPGAADGSLAARLAAWASEARRDPEAPPDPLCYRSREELFESGEEPIASLKREVLAGLSAAVGATTLRAAAESGGLTVRARARLAIIRPNGCLPAASLPLASWCAIYCVAAPETPADRPLSGVLRLYEPRLSNMFLDGSNWQLRPPFANGHQTWRPVAGHLAAFPAWLTHEVALNRCDRDLMLVIARARFANPGQDEEPPW
ncbi:MAG TPA: hypothetical protein VNX02_04730 [Steroidobacteraceae bacterium]|jgi:hypothetical protein|nr:hypothetical protein [Steroidobacteraceae bacterium]